MKKYFLYVKTHNTTGLKYLGYTTRDPETYSGSGTYWKRHLKVHGRNLTTEIIGTYSSHQELKEAGVYYSQLFGVETSEEWANLKTEQGQGGGRPSGWNHSTETKERLRELQLGIIPWSQGKTKETDPRLSRISQLISEYRKGRPAWNKGLPNSTAAENGRKSADKQRQTVTGRKLAKRPDGTRYWTYPNRNNACI